MRKITCNYLFPVISEPLKNGILILNDDGVIEDVIDSRGLLYEVPNLEYYNGIMVPGFINAHCHLELSYLKGRLNSPERLVGFIQQILAKRSIGHENAYQATIEADNEMRINGIVGVGDISNEDISFQVKSRSSISYYTFIEVFDLFNEDVKAVISKGNELLCLASQTGMEASLVPHAPYSVSGKLFRLINSNYTDPKKVYSIHNQETQAENELFISGKSELSELFIKMGMNMSNFVPTGKTSLRSLLPIIPNSGNILFIHNTFTGIEDVEDALSKLKNVFWVICPNSNLIIEKRLPDIKMMLERKLNIAIGTDSYASNSELSILSELKIISKNFPGVSVNDLISWATINGAKALHMDDEKGSFEKGKRPGVNLITGFDFENMRFSGESKVKVLM